MNISDSLIRYNYVKSNYLRGGGIYSENSRIKINKTHLDHNFADEGGAICSINSSVDIYTSLIYNNYANWYDGAIVTDSNLFINNTRIYNNRAGYKGGAIHTTYYSIENCYVDINYTSILIIRPNMGV